MALLQISQLGSPVLREVAEQVENIKDQNIQQLIDDLIETVADSTGVGISAPQVYQSRRIFILSPRPSSCDPTMAESLPIVVINPTILSHSDEMVKGWEGCLSIPGIRGNVPRYKAIEAEYYTHEGMKVRQEFSDFIARIFQHEYDHLEGIVIFDRLESTRDIIMDKEYQKLLSQRL